MKYMRNIKKNPAEPPPIAAALLPESVVFSVVVVTDWILAT